MPSFESLAVRQAELIRKALGGIIAVAPMSASLPTALTSGGTAEVQTVTITGTPTGGSFTLTLSGETTATILFSAIAGTVQTALEALSNVGAGNVTVGGGPGPGTPYTVTFSSVLGDVPQMTKAHTFTGGTAPDVTVTTTTPGTVIELASLSAAYKQLGYVTKDDGIVFGRETENADVTSWGAVEPTRRDIVSDVKTAAFTCQETSRQVLELSENVDLSTVVPDAATGETAFNSSTIPQNTYRRMVFLSYDGAGTDRIYIAKIMPRAIVSEAGEQTWSDQSELNYPMTITATVDTTAGYSVRHILSGPGWRSLLTEAGFAA